MNHEQVQLVLSSRMDGERVVAHEADAAAAHAAGCSQCRAFADRSARVRSAVRIRPAEPVPDLVDGIMAAVAVERSRPAAIRTLDRARGRRAVAPRRRSRLLAPAAAAAVVGLVGGSVLVGGPWQRPADRPIAAAALVREVRRAAPSIDAFQGTYTIVERGFSSDVSVRRFEMRVAFRSSQRFRLDVTDHTDYPASWTPNDLTYIEHVPATYLAGPSGCPADLAPDVCPRTRATVVRSTEFSTSAPLPADVVLPLATFASPRGFRVVGGGTFDGRETVRVELTYERASPMFPFLRTGGSWRPFYGRDRVVLWLDRTSWQPVRWTVSPSAGPERRAWELRFGMPEEAPGATILDVRLESSSEEAPDASLFEIPGSTPSAVGSLGAARDRLGYAPAAPAGTGGLDLVSVVLPPEPARATPSSLLIYADGLDYLRVGERLDWSGPGPFGPLDADAEAVTLAGGGIAYYEPAGEGSGRRLALHTRSGDLYLESNLPREQLLEIAASIPVRTSPLPRAWLERSSDEVEVERVPVRRALASAGLPASLSQRLPGGYVIASAERSTIGERPAGLTFFLRQLEMDAAGEPLALHLEPAGKLPPASPSSGSTVTLLAGEGRWTPGRSLLEWIDGETYHSLQGPLPLSSLMEIANAVTSAEAAP
ncbi:MAG TPA: hypothetical protein VE800_09080 [Actinomycetota bacterium]|nr:hypothetical protein [Actinomycetota bacterium]